MTTHPIGVGNCPSPCLFFNFPILCTTALYLLPVAVMRDVRRQLLLLLRTAHGRRRRPALGLPRGGGGGRRAVAEGLFV